MSLLKTYENWIRGEFVFQETYVQESDGNSHVEKVQVSMVTVTDLPKIAKEQKDFGLKQKERRLKIAKEDFLIRFRNTLSIKELFLSEFLELERILRGQVSEKFSFYSSTTFNLQLNRMQLDGISKFYFEVIEKESSENYSFIASPLVFPDTNEMAPQGLAYFIYELRNWLKEFKNEKLARLAEFERHEHFPIILSYANGNIYKWRKEGFDYDDIAERLNVVGLRPYISETFNAKLSSDKSLYNRPKLISLVKEYCELVGIDLCPEFVAQCEKVEHQKAARKPLL